MIHTFYVTVYLAPKPWKNVLQMNVKIKNDV